MATASAIDTSVWVHGTKARARAGITATTLHHLSLSGRIRTLALVGLPVRYNGADCDEIRKGSLPSRPRLKAKRESLN